MATSIYNIQDWANGTYYPKNSIVQVSNGDFYYALSEHTSHASQTFFQSYSSLTWGGVTTDDLGISKPHFVWKPSYSSSLRLVPRVKVTKFGDGWEQRVPDGINYKLLRGDVSFNERSELETTAISHFIGERGGFESFLWVPPSPYATQRRFVCRAEPVVNCVFRDNFSITLQFEEVVN